MNKDDPIQEEGVEEEEKSQKDKNSTEPLKVEQHPNDEDEAPSVRSGGEEVHHADPEPESEDFDDAPSVKSGERIIDDNNLKKVGDHFKEYAHEKEIEVENEIEEMDQKIKKENTQKMLLNQKSYEVERKKLQERKAREEKKNQEEKIISQSIKFSYFLETRQIRNIREKNIKNNEESKDNQKSEATLIEKMKNLDKKPIPKNKKYFLKGALIKPPYIKSSEKKQQIGLQNVSVKDNDLLILGKEKNIKPELKKFPEELDTIVQKKIEAKAKYEKKQYVPEKETPEPTPDPEQTPQETPTPQKDDCVII